MSTTNLNPISDVWSWSISSGTFQPTPSTSTGSKWFNTVESRSIVESGYVITEFRFELSKSDDNNIFASEALPTVESYNNNFSVNNYFITTMSKVLGAFGSPSVLRVKIYQYLTNGTLTNRSNRVLLHVKKIANPLTSQSQFTEETTTTTTTTTE